MAIRTCTPEIQESDPSICSNILKHIHTLYLPHMNETRHGIVGVHQAESGQVTICNSLY